MCTICATFRPHLSDCDYRALGATAPDPGTVAAHHSGLSANATITETTDAAAGPGTAYVIDVSDTFLGDISGTGDRDWVAIELTAGMTYLLTASGEGVSPLGDAVLRVRDSDGTILAINDDAGNGFDAALGFTATATGTHFIDIGGWHDVHTGGYRLSTAVDGLPRPFGTNDQLADYLINGFWADFGGSAHSFDTAASTILTVDIDALNADGQRLALWALQAFEQIIDVQFQVVTSGARLTFGDDQAGAFATYTGDGNGNVLNAFVNVSTSWLTSNGVEINDYSFQTYLHEIGHALGLGHQGNYNGSATYGVDNTFANDSWLVSMMSYFDIDENVYAGSGYAGLATPMVVDVIALQAIYGAADVVSSPTAGNTVFGVGHTFTNAFFGGDLNANGSYMAALFNYITTGADPGGHFDATPIAFTIADVGGIDLIDLSTDLSDQFVSLAPESLSTVFNPFGTGRNDNMWIARGTLIENFNAGLGNDRIVGNAAANRILGNTGADLIDGQGGNDTLFGGVGADDLDGGTGNDSLLGEAGADTLRGGAGNDTLIGGSGADVIFGGDGDDTLIGDEDADTMDGGEAADTYYVQSGDIVTDTGTTGYDRAQITTVAGQVIAMAGWSGIERVNGHLGDDTIDATGQTADLVIFGGSGADRLVGGAGNDSLLGDAGDDVLIGGDGRNVFLGGTGNDTFTGGAGDDTFYIGESGDSITDGGDGMDVVYVDSASGLSLGIASWLSVERISGFSGNDTLDGTGASRALVLMGEGGDDVLIGGVEADILLGGAGNDTLHGGDGNDTLQGRGDADTYFGGGGNDTFYIGQSADRVTDGGTGFDTAQIDEPGGLSVQTGTWLSVERVNGHLGNDTIDATAATAALILSSEAGADVVIGGGGNDTIYAGSGHDSLSGGAGNDALIGDAGDDSLSGDAGNDFLLGGAGADVFRFAEDFGRDVIADFQIGNDRLDFTGHIGVASLADLAITGNGTHTYIALAIGGPDQLTLANFNGSLAEADFNFA